MPSVGSNRSTRLDEREIGGLASVVPFRAGPHESLGERCRQALVALDDPPQRVRIVALEHGRVELRWVGVGWNRDHLR